MRTRRRHTKPDNTTEETTMTTTDTTKPDATKEESNAAYGKFAVSDAKADLGVPEAAASPDALDEALKTAEDGIAVDLARITELEQTPADADAAKIGDALRNALAKTEETEKIEKILDTQAAMQDAEGAEKTSWAPVEARVDAARLEIEQAVVDAAGDTAEAAYVQAALLVNADYDSLVGLHKIGHASDDQLNEGRRILMQPSTKFPAALKVRRIAMLIAAAEQNSQEPAKAKKPRVRKAPHPFIAHLAAVKARHVLDPMDAANFKRAGVNFRAYSTEMKVVKADIARLEGMRDQVIEDMLEAAGGGNVTDSETGTVYHFVPVEDTDRFDLVPLYEPEQTLTF